MRITFKATNVELTNELREYTEKRLNSISLLSQTEDTLISVELAQTTRHHKSGDIFKAEVMVHMPGKQFRAESEKGDIHTAIDDMRDELAEMITSNKTKAHTLFRRGALKAKEMLKGLTNWRRK
jgi:ribosomal subunit interface protein